MKITFSTNGHAVFFNSTAEWDNHPMSAIGWNSNYKRGTYQPRFESEPARFPCVCVYNELFVNKEDLHSPDFWRNTFIYDVEASAEEGEKDPEGISAYQVFKNTPRRGLVPDCIFKTQEEAYKYEEAFNGEVRPVHIFSTANEAFQSHNDELRRRALEKLTMDERKALGL